MLTVLQDAGGYDDERGLLSFNLGWDILGRVGIRSIRSTRGTLKNVQSITGAGVGFRRCTPCGISLTAAHEVGQGVGSAK